MKRDKNCSTVEKTTLLVLMMLIMFINSDLTVMLSGFSCCHLDYRISTSPMPSSGRRLRIRAGSEPFAIRGE